jgi:2-polyprenyl-6-methoxyphenol hydroxylase-like FAD-dependent oxidoreductase
MTTKPPSIAIIGAGLGGLTLSRILAKNSIPSTIYEADPSPTHRAQGGTLDLKPDTGQRAIKLAGLLDGFRSLARAAGEDMRILDKHGKIHFEEVGNGNLEESYNPEIDRHDLKDLFLGVIGPETVKWGYKLIDLVALNGKFQVVFSNGIVEVVDVVVGADGAWSKVRNILSSQKPVYTGLSSADLRISKLSQGESMERMVGKGSMLALSDNKAIIAQRTTSGNLTVYATLRVDATWSETSSVATSPPDKQISQLLAYFNDWNDDLLQFIRCCDRDKIILRPIYALPVGFRWTHMSGVTLIGDAAHVMSPYAGEGVNLAMADAADLAEAIVAGRYFALATFEEEMWTRAEEAARESAENLEVFFGDDAAEKVAEIFKSHGPPPE